MQTKRKDACKILREKKPTRLQANNLNEKRKIGQKKERNTNKNMHAKIEQPQREEQT